MRKFAPFPVVVLGLLLLLTLLVPRAAFAGTGTYPIDGTGVTLTMTTPNTYSLCSSGNDTVTVTGMPIDGSFRLSGYITVQYALDGGGRQTVPNGFYPVDTTNDLSVQVSYPAIGQWPVLSSGTAEVIVDIAIEVYVNGFKEATLGPGQQWGVFCLNPPVAAEVAISGPTAGNSGMAYDFTATASPITATTPITYVWQATGQSPVTHVGALSDTVSFLWNTSGTKTITVTAANLAGSAMGTHDMDLIVPRLFFLPLVIRASTPLYADDFSNPFRGWDVFDNGNLRFEYLGGE